MPVRSATVVLRDGERRRRYISLCVREWLASMVAQEAGGAHGILRLGAVVGGAGSLAVVCARGSGVGSGSIDGVDSIVASEAA